MHRVFATKVWVLLQLVRSVKDPVDPWLSQPCAEARQKYGLNFTKLQVRNMGILRKAHGKSWQHIHIIYSYVYMYSYTRMYS
jgi:hypothetical protein